MPDSSPPGPPLRKVAESIRAWRARHQERHRPTGFGFAFADRVDYLDRETWDQVTAEGSIFLRRGALRVLEQHGPQNVVPRYAMIFRDARPVAVIAATETSPLAVSSTIPPPPPPTPPVAPSV